jgi:hypothetical protein
MNRIRFLIVENLPQSGTRINTHGLIDNVVRDLSAMDSMLGTEEIVAALDDLNERQYIVLFNDETVAMTQLGARMMF